MDYYKEIKEQLLLNEINRIVKDYSKNKNDLKTYYNVGKLLTEFQNNASDDNIIKECSIKLTNEIGKGYSITNLKYMMKFYEYFKGWEELPIQLNWSHYIELLSLNNTNEINYYIQISLKQNLSYRELHRKIRNKEYEKIKLKNKELLTTKNNNINDNFIEYSTNKINQQNNKDIIREMEKQLILENNTNIINHLGNSFCFIASKYKIKIEEDYNYIDLLLYNIEYNCYIVVKFQTKQTENTDIYQIKKYIEYIDKLKKNNNQNKTIGIILRKKKNELLIEYSSDKRIFTSSINN